MKIRGMRGAVAVGLGVLAMVAPVGVAQAESDKDFTNWYSMIYRVYGATTFHVVGDGRVPVSVYQTSGATTTYTINIEREVCGVFGCSWKDRFYGGDCVRTISNTTPKSCNFSVGNSQNRHRVVLTKANNGARVKGEVTVR